MGAASIIQNLRKARVQLDRGLRDDEFEAIEQKFAFRFPPDLRELLGQALPLGDGFPHWRRATGKSREAESIATSLRWPLEGALFDAEHDDFWPGSWRPGPGSLEERKAELTRRIQAAPPLIPVFGHRYIPSVPAESGNPVLSVYQTDIIYYGRDLTDYFATEFQNVGPDIDFADVREVPFWTAYVRDCWDLP